MNIDQVETIDKLIEQFSYIQNWTLEKVTKLTLCYSSHQLDQVKAELNQPKIALEKSNKGSNMLFYVGLGLVNITSAIIVYSDISSINLVLPLCLVINMI